MAVKQEIESVASKSKQGANHDDSVTFEVNIQSLKDGVQHAITGNPSLQGEIASLVSSSKTSIRKTFTKLDIDVQFWFSICQYYGLENVPKDINSALQKLDAISIATIQAGFDKSPSYLEGFNIHYCSTLIVYLHIADGSFNNDNAKRKKRYSAFITMLDPFCTYNLIVNELAPLGIMFQQIAELFEYKEKVFTKHYRDSDNPDIIEIKHLNVEIPKADIEVARRCHKESALNRNSISFLWLSRDFYINASDVDARIDWDTEDDNSIIEPAGPLYINSLVKGLQSFLNDYTALDDCIVEIEDKIKNDNATYRDLSFILAYSSARYGYPEAVKVVLQFCISNAIDRFHRGTTDQPYYISEDNYVNLAHFYIILSFTTSHFKLNVPDCLIFSDDIIQTDNLASIGQYKYWSHISDFTKFAEHQYILYYLVGREFESVLFSSKDEYDYIGISEFQPRADFVAKGEYSLCTTSAIGCFRISALAGYQPAIDRLKNHYPDAYNEMLNEAASPRRSRGLF